MLEPCYRIPSEIGKNQGKIVMPRLDCENALDFASAMFIAAGVPSTEAQRVATSLVDANLCGHDSHGIIRVVQYIKAIEAGILKPGAPFVLLSETPSAVAADGGWNLGQVQAYRLLEKLIAKAFVTGVAAGSLKQCGHIGRLGEYAEEAARHKMAFLATVNNHGFGRAVAPPGGKVGRISTNPICVGAPTKANPVVLDIGTSVCAEGKVRVNYNKKIPTPEGWLLDSEGRPTTDPGVLYNDPKGTILPLGGQQSYKGFGLGLLMDMFAGGLSGAQCSTPGVESKSANAVFFLVIDPAKFAGVDHFLHETTNLAANVLACPKAEGATNDIILPGQLEVAEKSKRTKSGLVLDEGTWSQLKELAQKYKVPMSDSVSN